MNRTEDFDKILSEELKSSEFAKAYFLSIMQDIDGAPGLTLIEALKHIIRKMGTKEYADLIGLKRQNISRFLTQTSSPKLDTINRMLSPFELKAKIALEIDNAA